MLFCEWPLDEAREAFVHEFAISEEPEVAPPPLDEDGLPVRRAVPMSWPQQKLAGWLGSSLRELCSQRELRCHVEVDGPVDYLPRGSGPEGRKRVFPDVYVVVDHAQEPSGTYRVGVTGRPPDVVFELAVASSLGRDLGEKVEKYAEMGVAEYFVFDVDKVAIPGLLKGYRLGAGGEYEEIPRLPTADGLVRLHSERLKLDVGVVEAPRAQRGSAPRLFRPGELVPLPTEDEGEQERALARERELRKRALAREQAERKRALADQAQELRVEQERALAERDVAWERRLAELAQELAALKRERERGSPPGEA